MISPEGIARQAGSMTKKGKRSSGLSVAPAACLALMILSERLPTKARPRSVPTPEPRNARPAVEVVKW